MDIKKSQKKLSAYRSYMRIREGLNYSDYFDDSIPNEVKPVYSLTPMQEDDFPTQAKDLFKGLWEDIINNWGNYWMDSSGKLIKIQQKLYHIDWAKEWLTAHNIPFTQEDIDNGNIYEMMFDRHFIRVKILNNELQIVYNPLIGPSNLQWRILNNSAIESSMKLIDCSGAFDKARREIELTESVILSENKTARTLFIESMMPDNMDTFKSHLAQLFTYLQKELQLKTVPKVKLLSDEKNADKVLSKTAHYNPDKKEVVLYITNRHQKDILRSFSHEVIHHWQHENEQLKTSKTASKKGNITGEDPQYAQNNPWLRQMEKQAYLLGNILFRDWEDEKKSKDVKSGKKLKEICSLYPNKKIKQYYVVFQPPNTSGFFFSPLALPNYYSDPNYEAANIIFLEILRRNGIKYKTKPFSSHPNDKLKRSVVFDNEEKANEAAKILNLKFGKKYVFAVCADHN